MSKAHLQAEASSTEEQQEGRSLAQGESDARLGNFRPAVQFWRKGWVGEEPWVFLRDHTGLCPPALPGLLGGRCAARELPT